MIGFSASQQPSNSFAENIPPDRLEHPVIRRGLEYWQRLLQLRAVPARRDIGPRPLRTLLPFVTLVVVIPENDDFELRIAGDAITCAFRFPVHRQRLSVLAPAVPRVVSLLQRQYMEVVRTRRPQGWRYAIDSRLDIVTFTGAEYLMLPLSDDGERVDHILGFTGFLSEKRF